MANGRYKMHGGKSMGAPKANQNARTHGICSDTLVEDQKGLWEQVEVRNLDNASEYADRARIAGLSCERSYDAQ